MSQPKEAQYNSRNILSKEGSGGDIFVRRNIKISKEFLPNTPRTSFQFFVDDTLSTTENLFRNLHLKTITKNLEKEWNNLSTRAKIFYQQKAKEDRERYVSQFKEARFKSFCSNLKSEDNNCRNEKMIETNKDENIKKIFFF